jgi:hypothetical protein
VNQNIHFDNIESGKLALSAEFISTFPTLAALLKTATVLDFTINNNQRFRQYSWALASQQSCGWLCQLEHVTPQDKAFIAEHILLVKNIGGIVNSWGNFSETLLTAKNFLFGLQVSFNGIDTEDNYLAACEADDLTPIDLTQVITFAMDANGDCTFYDKNTKKIFLHAQSGYSDFDITLLDNQPEYSIYRYVQIHTFVDYVETLASQMQLTIGAQQ